MNRVIGLKFHLLGTKTTRDIAGHVSKQLLKHYSHISQQAKRRAVDAQQQTPVVSVESKESTKVDVCTSGKSR